MPNVKIIAATLLFAAIIYINSSCCINWTELWENVKLFFNILNFVLRLIYLPLFCLVVLGYISAVNISLTVIYGGFPLRTRRILITMLRMIVILSGFFLLSGISTAINLYYDNNCSFIWSTLDIKCECDDKETIECFSGDENISKLMNKLEHQGTGSCASLAAIQNTKRKLMEMEYFNILPSYMRNQSLEFINRLTQSFVQRFLETFEQHKNSSTS